MVQHFFSSPHHLYLTYAARVAVFLVPRAPIRPTQVAHPTLHRVPLILPRCHSPRPLNHKSLLKDVASVVATTVPWISILTSPCDGTNGLLATAPGPRANWQKNEPPSSTPESLADLRYGKLFMQPCKFYGIPRAKTPRMMDPTVLRQLK